MVSTKMWMRKTWWCKVVDPQTLVIPQCGSTKLPYSDIITFCGRTNLHGTVLWIHTCASSVFVHPQKCKFQPWIYRPDPKKIRGNAAQFFPDPFELWVSKIAKPEIPRLANLENQVTGSFFFNLSISDFSSPLWFSISDSVLRAFADTLVGSVLQHGKPFVVTFWKHTKHWYARTPSPTSPVDPRLVCFSLTPLLSGGGWTG